MCCSDDTGGPEDSGTDTGRTDTGIEDSDGDGYSAEEDCDDANPDVNPGAIEVCDNGLDDDCDGDPAEDEGCALVGLHSLSEAAMSGIVGPTYGGYTGYSIALAHQFYVGGSVGVLIGSPNARTNLREEGTVHYLDGLPTSVSELGDNELLVSGEVEQVHLGYSLATSPDSGDGYGALIVGRFRGADSQGAIYLVYGPSTGRLGLVEADGSRVSSDAADSFAVALAGGFDFDADGVGDWAVGDDASDIGGDQSGCVFLYSGPVTGTSTAETGSTVLWGAGRDDGFGRELAAVRDLSGDGIGDLVVSAPTPGRMYVFLGPMSDGSSSSADWVIGGFDDAERVGHRVASVGDSDGDGVDDMAFSVRYPSQEQQVYVVRGSAEFVGLEEQTIVVLQGPPYNFSVSGIAGDGDFDGDGHSDLVIGAAGEASDEGRAHLLFGPVSGTLEPADFDAVLVGEVGGDLAGTAVELGDIDDDGFDDLILGASGASGGTGRGAVYYWLGSSSL